MDKSDATPKQSGSEQISKKIADLGDWRGEVLGRMRHLILQVAPDAQEACKWMGTPVWSWDGILCTGESYKQIVKLTFAQGAFLPDPAGLFNASLEGNVRRAIDIRHGESIDEDAFRALIAAAMDLNAAAKATCAAKAKRARTTKA